MYFLRPSLSVTVLSFFFGATYAQDYDPESSIIPTTTAPPHTMTTRQPRCLVTTGGSVRDTCIFFSTIEDSQTTAPRESPGTMPEAVNCYTTRVYDTCPGHALLAHTTCLTTLTAHEGHVVVVDCGDGFESGYPPTMTLPSPHPAAPTTVCIENRCFDVIGTFGSPTSSAATPTQTQSKDEL